MGLLDIFKSREKRANPLENPAVSLTSPAIFSWLTGGEPTAAGEDINHFTAMQSVSVFACVRVIAESVASLPCKLYADTDKGRIEAFDNLVWNSQSFIGIGSVAKIGTIQEGTDVHAYGTSVTLSGIDPVLLGECMTDMVPGAQAQLWLGLLANGNIVGQPYQIFNGTMDQPTVSVGVDTISITLALETKMIDMARASNRRYTSADQRLYYPKDSAFGWVESLNDQADVWG